MWHGSFVRLREDHPTSRQSCTVPLSKSWASIPRNGIASSAKLHFHLIIGFKDAGPCTGSDWVWKKLHLWPDKSDLYRRITALSLQWPHTLPLILPRILALRPMDVEGAEGPQYCSLWGVIHWIQSERSCLFCLSPFHRSIRIRLFF